MSCCACVLAPAGLVLVLEGERSMPSPAAQPCVGIFPPYIYFLSLTYIHMVTSLNTAACCAGCRPRSCGVQAQSEVGGACSSRGAHRQPLGLGPLWQDAKAFCLPPRMQRPLSATLKLRSGRLGPARLIDVPRSHGRQAELCPRTLTGNSCFWSWKCHFGTLTWNEQEAGGAAAGLSLPMGGRNRSSPLPTWNHAGRRADCLLGKPYLDPRLTASWLSVLGV